MSQLVQHGSAICLVVKDLTLAWLRHGFRHWSKLPLFYPYTWLQRDVQLRQLPSIDFMEIRQRDINASMRGILVDWLVEVCTSLTNSEGF